jgi:hypothetical protein
MPRGTSKVLLAPGQKFALIQHGRAPVSVVSLDGDSTAGAVEIPGALPAPDTAVFSPRGSAAILLSGAAARMQVIGGLPDNPRIVRDLNLGALPQPVQRLAVSDDAGSLLVSTPATVFLILPDGSARTLVSVSQAPLLAFFPGSASAVAGDPGDGSLYLVQNTSGTASARLLGMALAGMGDMRVNGSGDRIYVTAEQQIGVFGVQDGVFQTFDSPVAAGGLDRLLNDETFVISSVVGGPIWIFFRDGDSGRTAFVPAPSRSSNQRRGFNEGKYLK